MRAPHIRMVYPPGTPKGVASLSRKAKFYITLPDHEEVEIPALRAATLKATLDDVSRVKLEILGTLEIVYADEEG